MNTVDVGARIGRWVGGVALAMSLLSGCGGGGGAEVGGLGLSNSAPVPAFMISGMVQSGTSGVDVVSSAGADLLLSGAGSTDADGDSLSYQWSITSKPASSNIVIPATDSIQQTVRPDVGGTYVFNLRVTDSKGAYSDRKATIEVRANAAPSVNVVVTASYAGLSTTKPTQLLNVGSSVVLDSAGSTDADGDVVTTTWTMTERPAGSSAGLTFDGKTSRFVADAAGLFKVRARGTDPLGAFSDTTYVFEARNRAPQTIVLATVSAEAGAGGAASISAATGYVVSLNGTLSSDPEGTALTYAWSIASKPGTSAAVLTNATGPVTQITPDVLGDYIVKMTVTDASGAASNYLTTVSVRNRRPLAAISSNANPVAMPTGPAVRLPLNTLVTLRGTGSVDADGDTLSYSWTLSSKPAGSAAALSSATAETVQLTPDVAGTYVVSLKVTDSGGAFSEKALIIEAGNYAPVAVVDKNRITVVAGTAATASAALSFDEEGDALTYQWALDASPAGSSAAISAPSTAALSFTPDLAGTYVASVTVSDGKSSSVGYVTIKALASAATNVPLNFAPLEARYSKGLDKLVVVATNPNTVKIIDPFTASIRTVLLPAGVKAMNLSPDGKLAAVLHEGIVSLVDLDAGVLIRSSATSGSQTDAFLTDAGMIYMIGQTGGQWVDQAVGVIDGRTGVNMSATLGLGPWIFYGTQRGIYAPLKGKVFLMEMGLSPADINYFVISKTTGAVTSHGDSPYHGDYYMSTPLFLSGSEDLLFTSSGTYFRTDTLQYAGKFTVTGSIVSMSHGLDADEALLMTAAAGSYPGYEKTYAASYQRFGGALFLPDTAISLPVIDSAQSYGMGIYHSANGNHVALVQTGAATQNASGIKYYVTTR